MAVSQSRKIVWSEGDTVIPSAYADELRRPCSRSDFLRRTLRRVVIVGGLTFLIFPFAAGAAEVQTYSVLCGGASSPVAQLVPAGERTSAIDITGRRPVTFDSFQWCTTQDSIATNLHMIRAAMRTQEIDGGCEASMRIVPVAGPMQHAVVSPLPPGISPAVNSYGARDVDHWTHADIRFFIERGQGQLITTPNALAPDPNWPQANVAAAIVFFSPGNGGQLGAGTLYGWSEKDQRYQFVSSSSSTTKANINTPTTRAIVLADLASYLRIPTTIPASASDPGLDLYIEDGPFYRALESGVGQCVGENGSHEAMAQCYAEGNAMLLGSQSAQSYDPAFGEKKIVGVVRFVGKYYGDVSVWVPDQGKYMSTEPFGTQGYLCRRCMMQSKAQEVLRTAMRPNFMPSQPSIDTSATSWQAPVETQTAPAPSAEPLPIQQAEGYEEVWSWRAEWSGLPWYGQALVILVLLLLIPILWFCVAYVRTVWKIGRQRRQLASAQSLEASVDELFRMTEQKRREVEKMVRKMQR